MSDWEVFAAGKDNDVPMYSANELRQLLKDQNGRCASAVSKVHTSSRSDPTDTPYVQACLNAPSVIDGAILAQGVVSKKAVDDTRAANLNHVNKIRSEARSDLMRIFHIDALFAEDIVAAINEGKIANLLIYQRLNDEK